MSHDQIGIVLSKEDWLLIVRILDHTASRGMATIESAVIADYSDTLFSRLQEAQAIRLRSQPVPARQDGARAPETCICSECQKYLAGGL